MNLLNLLVNIGIGSYLLLGLKALHSFYIGYRTQRMLDRDHAEYLKHAPREGVDYFVAESLKKHKGRKK